MHQIGTEIDERIVGFVANVVEGEKHLIRRKWLRRVFKNQAFYKALSLEARVSVLTFKQFEYVDDQEKQELKGE